MNKDCLPLNDMNGDATTSVIATIYIDIHLRLTNSSDEVQLCNNITTMDYVTSQEVCSNSIIP